MLALLQEEQEWQALLDKVEHLDQQQLAVVAGAGAAPSGEAPIAALEAEAGLVAGHPAVDELAALARLHAGVHRRLAMQVEGVCKLVGDVEEMVERANRGAQAVQVGPGHGLCLVLSWLRAPRSPDLLIGARSTFVGLHLSNATNLNPPAG